MEPWKERDLQGGARAKPLVQARGRLTVHFDVQLLAEVFLGVGESGTLV